MKKYDQLLYNIGNFEGIYTVLRKFIKSFIPNKGDEFYNLFETAAINAHNSAKLFLEILHSKDEAEQRQIEANSRQLKNESDDINKKVLKELNHMLITPMDRGDIQELANILNKLTKRIGKLSTKLNIYNIDANTDDCLITNANTLLSMTSTLVECIRSLKEINNNKLESISQRINELEENGIEDFRHAINEIYSGKFDTLTILKLKEIYKSIDAAIELCVNAADVITKVSLKNI